MALVAATADPARALALLAAADEVRAEAAVAPLPTQEPVARAVRARAEQQLDPGAVRAAAASGRDLDLTSLCAQSGRAP